MIIIIAMNDFFNADIKKYEKLIQKVNVISFDIFDTLLIRPYQKPTDLFLHMESLYNMPGFVHERTIAECRARYKSGKEDITFDDIYDEIQDKYKSLKDKELEIETQVISAHPVIKKLYEIALQRGKKVIAISDMYLPETFLRTLLEKNGYANIDKIYVSSEIGKCKYTKNLYEFVYNDLGVKPNQILHIGDNITSDLIMAKESGLNALHIDTYINKFNKTIWGKRFKKLEKKYNSLDFSLLKAMVAQHVIFSENRDYWYTLAYILGGILALGYVQFIDKRSQFFDIKQLLFISRDGYLLEKIYNKYSKNPVKTQYIYAPRILNLKCFCDFRGNKEYFDTIIKFLNEEGANLNYDPVHDNMYEFYNNHKQIFDDYAKEHRIEYEKYLNALNLEQEKTAIVDGVTGAFSSQAFLMHFLGNNLLLGFFLYSHNASNQLVYNSFFEENNKQVTPFLVCFWELLLSSPEAPIIAIKNTKPIFAQTTDEIQYRQNLFDVAEIATLDFINLYNKFFSNIEKDINNNLIFEIFNIFEQTLTNEDKSFFSTVCCSNDVSNLSYIPIYNKNLSLFVKFKIFILKYKRKIKNFYVKIIRLLKWNIKILIYKNANLKFYVHK